jgi:hypothetical protein
MDRWRLTAIGTVIGSVGTVGAFAVALYLLRVQISDRRRGQARLVNAWLAEMRVDEKPLPVFVVRVDNSSEEPAYGVRVQLVYGNSGTFVRDIGVLGPQEVAELDIVVPGLRNIDPAPDVTFTDAAGRRWTRYGRSGKLIDGEPSPPFQQDAGAYPSIADHPTLGNEIDGRTARRILKAR